MANRLFIAIVMGKYYHHSFNCLVPVDSLAPPLPESGHEEIKALVAEKFCRKHWENLEEVPGYEEMKSPQQAFHVYFNENQEGESCTLSYFDPGELSRETLERMLQDVT